MTDGTEPHRTEEETRPAATEDTAGRTDVAEGDEGHSAFSQRARDQLEALASEDAEADVSALFQLLSRHLTDRPITEGTWASLRDAVDVFLDTEGLSVVAWLSHQDRSRLQKYIDQIGLSPVASRLLRRILTLYGTELEIAWDMSWGMGLADDWHGVLREVHRNVESGDYSVRLDIRKNNRETVRLEGDPRSMVRLARHFVDTLALVDDAAGFGDPDVLDRFFRAVDRFRSQLGYSAPSADDKESQ